MTTTVEPVYIK